MGRMMGAVTSSLHFAVRSLRGSPGFTLGVVLTLALGVGANATMFRVVDRLLLRAPDHIERPDDVRRLFLKRDLEGHGPLVIPTFTYADIQALRERGVFSRGAAYATPLPWTLGAGSRGRRVQVSLAEDELFDLLGVTAVRGRFFGPVEDRPGATPTAVVSHQFWTSHFGGDPGALGAQLRLGPEVYEVVGVAPPGFTGPELDPVDIWLPMRRAAGEVWSEDWATDPLGWYFRAVVRKGPAADDEALGRRATSVFQAERPRLPGNPRILTSSLVRGRGPDAGEVVSVSVWLAAVSVLVLLVACANVANLMLARGARRRREHAVRRTLGITRTRLLAHLAAEGGLLLLLGGLGAVAVALVGGRVIYPLLLPGVDMGWSTDLLRVGSFTVGLTALAVVLASFLPVLRSVGRDVGPLATAGGARETGRLTMQRSFVVVQTALSTILLVGAGLFVSSLRSAMTTDLGFDPSRLLSVQIEHTAGEEEGLEARAEEILSRLPEVVTAARTVAIPFQQSWGLRLHRVEGGTVEEGRRSIAANAVGAGFFRTLGTDVLRGREFQPEDLVGGAEPVAVVSQRAAEVLWPDADPLGRCIHVGRGDDSPCSRVVGVVEGHHMFELEAEHTPTVWVPITHPEVGGTVGGVMVRTAREATSALPAIRGRLLEMPGVRFAEVVPLRTLMEPVLRPQRLGANVFTAFGALALLVAGLGLYSVLAFDVARRRREIGIRMAVGASRRGIRREVLSRAASDSGLGLLLGISIAAVGSSFLAPLLFQTSSRDPAIFGATAVILGLTTLLAAWVPARRATRVDPIECLTMD